MGGIAENGVFGFDGMRFDDGLRVNLLVNEKLVIELKSVEMLALVDPKQLLAYLGLLYLPLSQLIYFGTATFKEGGKCIVSGPKTFVSSRLRVNQNEP